MDEVMIGLREASEKYRVSYGTLIRRVNSDDRPFATQDRRATPDSDSSVWRIAESELAGLYELRDNAEAAEAQQSLDDAAAEVDRLKKELARQSEQLQSARNEAVRAVEERDKAWARVDTERDRLTAIAAEADAKQKSAEASRDQALTVIDRMLDEMPETQDVRRRARAGWVEKRSQFRETRDSLRAIGSGGEDPDPSET